VFASINYQGQHWIWSTDDAGASWDIRAHEFAEAYALRFVGDRLWAARSDGLWHYDFAPTALKPRLSPAARRAASAPQRRLDGRRVRRDETRFTEIPLRRSP